MHIYSELCILCIKIIIIIKEILILPSRKAEICLFLLMFCMFSQCIVLLSIRFIRLATDYADHWNRSDGWKLRLSSLYTLQGFWDFSRHQPLISRPTSLPYGLETCLLKENEILNSQSAESLLTITFFTYAEGYTKSCMYLLSFLFTQCCISSCFLNKCVSLVLLTFNWSMFCF